MTALAEGRRGLLVWQTGACGSRAVGVGMGNRVRVCWIRSSSVGRVTSCAVFAQWIVTGSLWAHVGTTFTEAVLAFAIGGLLGVLLGLALAVVPILSQPCWSRTSASPTHCPA